MKPYNYQTQNYKVYSDGNHINIAARTTLFWFVLFLTLVHLWCSCMQLVSPRYLVARGVKKSLCADRWVGALVGFNDYILMGPTQIQTGEYMGTPGTPSIAEQPS